MANLKKSGTGVKQARGDAFVVAVLEAALEQLAQVGFDRFSIPEVAALAGANKTSVYRRWPTKDALIKDALRTAMDHAEATVSSGSLRGDLIALARTLAEFLRSNAGRSVMRLLMNHGDDAELRGIAISAYGDVSRRAVWVAVEAAVRSGELRPAVEPATVLFTLAGALIHRVWVEKADPSESYVEEVVDIVLNGALAQRGPLDPQSPSRPLGPGI